jgi:hypothetical protein
MIWILYLAIELQYVRRRWPRPDLLTRMLGGSSSTRAWVATSLSVRLRAP